MWILEDWGGGRSRCFPPGKRSLLPAPSLSPGPEFDLRDSRVLGSGPAKLKPLPAGHGVDRAQHRRIYGVGEAGRSQTAK